MKKKISFNDFKKLELKDVKSTDSNKKLLKPTVKIQMESSRSNYQLTVNEPPTPRTNIEKIVEMLNDIVEEFESKNNSDLKNKASFILKEIMSNKMYQYEESTSKDHLNFFMLYSTNIEEQQLSSRKDNEDNEEMGVIKKSTKKFDKSELKFIETKSFGVDFDVFAYSDLVGRSNMLRQVVLSAFTYRNMIHMLKSSYLEDYIEDLRLGYTLEQGAFYHNVSKGNS